MNAQVAQASPLTSPRVGNETQQRGRFDLRSVREEDADAVRKLFWEALVVGREYCCWTMRLRVVAQMEGLGLLPIIMHH